jgi:hypothetical protein
MRHEEFAERMAGRLKAVAAALDEEERRIGRNHVSARANEMRVAAHMVRDASDAVTRAEERRSA